jgi:hypothetical protein
MPRADVRELLRLHQVVLSERERIVARLRELDQSLDALGMTATERFYGLYTPTGRTRNRQSLHEVVVDVLQKAKKPLGKQAILDAVLATGYRFSTDDPLNSLCVILYGKKCGIERQSKDRFTLAGQ